jgi:putative redox protein
VRKEMATKPVRRIASLSVTIDVAVALTDEQKQKLIHAAEICPVHGSLHPDIQVPITFRWAS